MKLPKLIISQPNSIPRMQALWDQLVAPKQPTPPRIKGSRGKTSRFRLSSPRFSERGSHQPPRYFSKGPLDANPKHDPAPIPYLLIETHERDRPRPVPGHPLLLRSLCKGKGVLRKNAQGLVYLDIDNRFIETMIPYLKAYGLEKPPYFTLFGSPEGAHIPVISSRESAFHFLGEIEEVGTEFSFTIEGLYSVEPTLWPEVEQVWFFKAHSPKLETLRRKYFLPPRLGGHSFHIAVAVKGDLAQSGMRRPLPMMRINVGFLAA